jgi:hypothetical protein
MNNLQKQALINASLTSLYIIGIGVFLYFGAMFKIGKNSFFTPIAFLFLFVFSASITAYLIMGKPAQMYVDGEKKEALTLLTYTLGLFSVFTLISLVLLIFLPR